MEVAADHDSPSHVAPSPPPAALRHVDLGDLAGGLDDAAYLACADAVSEAPASSTVGSSAAPSPTPTSATAGASAMTEALAHPSGTGLVCVNGKGHPPCLFDPKLGKYPRRCPRCLQKARDDANRRNQQRRNESLEENGWS